LDCPFRAFDSIFAECAQDNSSILVDFHAESSREKEALGLYLDGRASVVAGTHTHVQTADERILPGGTAYITDLGMCGFMDGVIGMDTKICLDRARKQVMYRMEVAAATPDSNVALQGIVVELDAQTRKAVSIKRS
jgi:calcineurin-like phosphoesterase